MRRNMAMAKVELMMRVNVVMFSGYFLCLKLTAWGQSNSLLGLAADVCPTARLGRHLSARLSNSEQNSLDRLRGVKFYNIS